MTKHALLIGVSEYPSEALAPLPAALRDIEAVRKVLIHPERGGFPERNVTLLENPGRLATELAIETLFSERQGDDLVLLFFSGHGIKDDTGRLYLATHDTGKTPKGELRRATAVAADTVHRYMEYSRSRRQVVILDSCFSGAFPEGLTIKDDGRVDIHNQLGGEGRAILASSGSSQYSFEHKDEGLSLYTRFLLQGIETGEADRNGNGIITIGDLHGHVRQKVREAQPAMNPEIYSGKEGYAIHIAQAPLGDPEERYAREVSQSIDHRGEISSIAARANLNDWRGRLELDPQTYDAIEAEIMAGQREGFRKKCQEYGEVVREILENQGSIEAEATHLRRRWQMLKLTEEDARKVEADIEREITAERQRHEWHLQRYAVLLDEAIRQEGRALSEETKAEMAGIRQILELSDGEAEEIQSRESIANVRPMDEPGETISREASIDVPTQARGNKGNPPAISTITENPVRASNPDGPVPDYTSWRILRKIEAQLRGNLFAKRHCLFPRWRYGSHRKSGRSPETLGCNQRPEDSNLRRRFLHHLLEVSPCCCWWCQCRCVFPGWTDTTLGGWRQDAETLGCGKR
uniref:Uncharacterized protein, contains caspase domain n=1 Tax=Candidatus Kentrum sp. LFY TaxID=2126342 RepID=A0A450WY44_9GAMM|nr:MAG: Uncharacterized protein, contains caspase domain [Candidatus Kentron sp. LFY]